MEEGKIVKQAWLIEGEVMSHMGDPGTSLQVTDSDGGAMLAVWMPHKDIQLAVATVLAMAEDLEGILIQAATGEDEE